MKLIVNGIAIEYRDEGSGPTLLFLHGWKDNLHTFEGLTRLLIPQYRIMRLDLPGFGETEMPKGTWDLDEYVKFVNDFLQKLDVRPYALIGHSFGGRIVIKGASSGILQPQKIILIDAAGLAKSRTAKNRLLTAAAKIGKGATLLPPLIFWRKRLRRKLYEKIGSDYFASGAMKGTFLNIIREDLTDAARKIACPSLIIWGENDTGTPVQDGRLLVRLIPNAILHIIENAGHFVHQEKPEEVSDLIKEFLPSNFPPPL